MIKNDDYEPLFSHAYERTSYIQYVLAVYHLKNLPPFSQS